MPTFWIKIIMMPIVIALVSLAARRWGNTIGGLIAGMPWVGGAILYFIGLEQGQDFMLNATPGALAGLISWLAFCMTYVWFGQKIGVLATLLAANVAFLLVGTSLQPWVSHFDIHAWFLGMIVSSLLSLKFFPKVKNIGKKAPQVLPYDIPLRMVMITAFVIGITYFAALLGPSWSGILTPFPIITATLAVFTHYTQGMYQVRNTLLGMYTGVMGFTVFLLAVAYLVPIYGLNMGFVLSLLLNVVTSLLAKYIFGKTRLY